MSFTVHCPARVGFMGNPSDGFQGKTLSFTLNNFYASVTLEKLPDSEMVEIIPNPALDITAFDTVHDLGKHTSVNVRKSYR